MTIGKIAKIKKVISEISLNPDLTHQGADRQVRFNQDPVVPVLSNFQDLPNYNFDQVLATFS